MSDLSGRDRLKTMWRLVVRRRSPIAGRQNDTPDSSERLRGKGRLAWSWQIVHRLAKTAVAAWRAWPVPVDIDHSILGVAANHSCPERRVGSRIRSAGVDPEPERLLLERRSHDVVM